MIYYLTYLVENMAGIIREAKEIRRFLEKRKKEIRKMIQASEDQGIPCDISIEDYTSQDLENEIKRFKEECLIALKLREAAISVGLIQPKSTRPLQIEGGLVGKYCLITIRPPDSTCFIPFKDEVEQYIKRPYFLHGEYAFEQCGESEEDLGNGFHVHILACVKDYVQFKELNRDVHKDISGDFMFQVGNEKRKFLRTQTDLEFCRNYIRGDKHSDAKRAAISLNATWRAMNALDDLYIFNNESSTMVVVEEAD